MDMDSVEEFVKKYNLIIDCSKSSDKVLFIRSSIRTEEEAQSFMKKFSLKTSTIWRVHYGNYNPQRVVFRKAWVCRHSSIRSAGIQENNCDAKLDMLVKKINPHTTKNDSFLLKKPPLPCIIRMHFKHNHNCQEDLKYLKVPDEVKELFNGYFDKGYGVAKAIKLQQEHMAKVKTVTSAHFVPSRRQGYYLYEMWRQQRSLSGIPCEDNDIDNNESWQVFDWDELISAIPQENPPVKKIATDSSRKIRPKKKYHLLSNKDNEIEECVPVTNADVTSQINYPVNKEFSSNSVLSTVYLLDGPVQTQHIANSSNHLNGSTLTVMNPNSLISLISPLSSSPVSSTITPISSIINIDNIASKPALNSYVKLLNENILEHESTAEDPSEILMNSSEITQSSYFQQSKDLDKHETETSSNYVPKYLKCDSKSNNQDSTSKFKILSDKNSLLSNTDRQIDITSQFCQPTLKNISSNFTAINQNSVIDICKMNLQKSNILNLQNPLSNVLNKPNDFISCVQSPSMNSLLSTNKKCSESSSTQIHITNTVHQSGAQVSMKSTVQPNPNPVVNALHVSEFLANQQSSDELMKIKEEPPDSNNLEESEYSDLMPKIIKISSVNTTKSLTKEEPVLIPNIKKEKDENGTADDDFSGHLCDILPQTIQGSTEEDDQQFLMSLLPELKYIPNDLKIKLKSDMQKLVSSAKNLANKRKRRKL